MKAEAMFAALIETIRRMTADNVDHIEEIAALELELDAHAEENEKLAAENAALKAALETGTKLIEDTTTAGKALLAQINEFYRLGYTNAVQHISAQIPEATFAILEFNNWDDKVGDARTTSAQRS